MAPPNGTRLAETRLIFYEELLEAARRAASRAYAPYSGFRVGSALLCAGDAAVFTGCNVENASYGLTLCAERVAAATAVAAGRHDFAAIAIYAEGPEVPVPCGACRQFLAEFNDGLVVVVSNGKSGESFLLSELLPRSFGRQSLPAQATPQADPQGGR